MLCGVYNIVWGFCQYGIDTLLVLLCYTNISINIKQITEYNTYYTLFIGIN